MIVSVIGLCHCGYVVRGVIELWLDRISLMIPGIVSIYRLAYFDFTKMFWRGMIQGSEFNPFMDFSLGVHERRAQSEYGGWMVMIRWV